MTIHQRLVDIYFNAAARGISSAELNKCELQEIAAMLGVGREDSPVSEDLSDAEIIKLRLEANARGETLHAEDVWTGPPQMEVNPSLASYMITRPLPPGVDPTALLSPAGDASSPR